MGPEIGLQPHQLVRPALHNRVTTYNCGAAVRHLLDAGRFVLSSVGLLVVFFWLLVARRLDARISAWSLLGAMGLRALKIYRLPLRMAQATRRLLGRGTRAGQGTTA